MKKGSPLTKWLTSAKAKRLFSLCRWLHVYISTALFTLLFFFCVTGITLNHPDWTGKSTTSHQYLSLPESIVETVKIADEIPLRKIQHFIESKLTLRDPRNIDVMPEFNEITYDYPVPAGYVFITVSIDEKQIEIERKEGSFLALMNDLHKGRYSGSLWKSLIDISAVFMLLFSITGLIILFQSAKHRGKGIYVLVVGCLTPLLLYYCFVPQI